MHRVREKSRSCFFFNPIYVISHICLLLDNCVQSQQPEVTALEAENGEKKAGDCVEDECNGKSCCHQNAPKICTKKYGNCFPG